MFHYCPERCCTCDNSNNDFNHRQIDDEIEGIDVVEIIADDSC